MLQDVEQNLNLEEFILTTNDFASNLIDEIKQLDYVVPKKREVKTICTCPKCVKGKIKLITTKDKEKRYICTNDKCYFTLHKKNTYGKLLSEKQIETLCSEGRSGIIKFKSKKGTDYKAKLILDEYCNIKLEFPSKDKK